MTTLNEKEITTIKKSVTSISEQASSIVIENPEDKEKAEKFLLEIKQAWKTVEERQSEITRPMLDSITKVRALFKPFTIEFESAEKKIKAKLTQYYILEEEKAEKEKARLAARVEKGTMKAETAIKKQAEIVTPAKSTSSSAGRVTMRTIPKVRVVDESLIPREYLVVDMVAITNAVLKQGLVIPGVERYEEKSLSATPSR